VVSSEARIDRNWTDARSSGFIDTSTAVWNTAWGIDSVPTSYMCVMATTLSLLMIWVGGGGTSATSQYVSGGGGRG